MNEASRPLKSRRLPVGINHVKRARASDAAGASPLRELASPPGRQALIVRAAPPAGKPAAPCELPAVRVGNDAVMRAASPSGKPNTPRELSAALVSNAAVESSAPTSAPTRTPPSSELAPSRKTAAREPLSETAPSHTTKREPSCETAAAVPAHALCTSACCCIDRKDVLVWKPSDSCNADAFLARAHDLNPNVPQDIALSLLLAVGHNAEMASNTVLQMGDAFGAQQRLRQQRSASEYEGALTTVLTVRCHPEQSTSA
ncbi:hypothetical protein T492DRAFT_1001408 [Pavlovales sp. CCMP2436]|nr:hypothetical protein T492DRAFT_1001408 [Pavlovales sp. CCMP2436]